MGDILRAEKNAPDSPWAKEIDKHMREGGLVPSELSVELLQSHLSKALGEGRRKFVLDGFPRKIEQAILFEKKVCRSREFTFLNSLLQDWFLQGSSVFAMFERRHDGTSSGTFNDFWKNR